MMDLSTEILAIASVIVVGLALRYLPHIRYYFPGSSDMFFHFSKIRNPSHGEEELLYPSLFHGVLRIAKKRDGTLPERGLCLLMPVFDIGTASIFYLFIRGPFSVELALIAMLLFLVTPTVVTQGITFSPRSIGLLLLTSSLLCFTLPFPLNCVAVLPVALTLLTHRLATQTLSIISLVLSFIDWQVGIIFLGGVGLALLLSKGRYLQILRSHLSFIGRYIKRGGLPNRRRLGVFLAPTIIGFFAYITIRLLPIFLPFPLVIFGLVISELPVILPFFESRLLIWGVACLLLLVFWLAGESYRYTYYAAVPFSYFSAFLLQSSQVFLFLAAVLIVSCIALSVFLSIRIQHLDRNIVSLLRHLSQVDDCTYFLSPYHLIRAARYFSQKEGIYVAFAETTREQVTQRVVKENITHVIVNYSHLDWFQDMTPIKQKGDWYLLQNRL